MMKEFQCRFCQEVKDIEDLEFTLKIASNKFSHVCRECIEIISKGLVSRKKRLQRERDAAK